VAGTRGAEDFDASGSNGFVVGSGNTIATGPVTSRCRRNSAAAAASPFRSGCCRSRQMFASAWPGSGKRAAKTLKLLRRRLLPRPDRRVALLFGTELGRQHPPIRAAHPHVSLSAQPAARGRQPSALPPCNWLPATIRAGTRTTLSPLDLPRTASGRPAVGTWCAKGRRPGRTFFRRLDDIEAQSLTQTDLTSKGTAFPAAHGYYVSALERDYILRSHEAVLASRPSFCRASFEQIRVSPLIRCGSVLESVADGGLAVTSPNFTLALSRFGIDRATLMMLMALQRWGWVSPCLDRQNSAALTKPAAKAWDRP